MIIVIQIFTPSGRMLVVASPKYIRQGSALSVLEMKGRALQKTRSSNVTAHLEWSLQHLFTNPMRYAAKLHTTMLIRPLEGSIHSLTLF